jgi:hypothetical protein
MMPVPRTATPTYFGMQPLTLAGATVTAAPLGQSPSLLYSVPTSAASFMTLRSPNAWLYGSRGNKALDGSNNSLDSRGFIWRCRFSLQQLSTPLRFFLGLQGVSPVAIPALTNTDVEVNAQNIIGIAFDSTFDYFKMRLVSKGNVNGSFDLDLRDASGGTGLVFGVSQVYDLTIGSFPTNETYAAGGAPGPGQEYTYSYSIKMYEAGKCYEASGLISAPDGSPRIAPPNNLQFGFSSMLSNAGVLKSSSQILRIHGMSSEAISTAPVLPYIT